MRAFVIELHNKAHVWLRQLFAIDCAPHAQGPALQLRLYIITNTHPTAAASEPTTVAPPQRRMYNGRTFLMPPPQRHQHQHHHHCPRHHTTQRALLLLGRQALMAW